MAKAKTRANNSGLAIPSAPDLEWARQIAWDLIVAYDACQQRDWESAKRLLAGVPKCVVRARDAGVHFGTLAWLGDKTVCLVDTSRIWRWEGKALSLSTVASVGIDKSSRVDGAIAVNWIYDAIELLPCTEQAIESILACGP